MGKASPPPAPDYTLAAKQQGIENLATAKAQGQINNPNVVSPYGTQTVSWGNFDQPGYDAAQANYQQALAAYNAQPTGQWRGIATSGGHGGSTSTMIGHGDASTPVTGQRGSSQQWSNLIRGEAPVAPTREQYTSNPYQPTLTQQFSPSQQALFEKSNITQGLLADLAQQGAHSAQGVLGTPVDYTGAPELPGNLDEVRANAIAAMMDRPSQDYARSQADLNANLQAAGLRPGSKGYDDQMALLQRSLTDAQMQAQVFGGQEATRQQQLAQQARNQWLQEYQTKRQTPLNEITALMSGSQVSNPFQIPGYAQNTQVAPAPLYNATQQLANYNSDIYNQQAAQQGQITSGLFGLGGAGLAGGLAGGGGFTGIGKYFSDRRLKSEIQRIGTHPLGIGWYRYQINGRIEEGVMADEVLLVKPHAVVPHESGYLMVNYGKL